MDIAKSAQSNQKEKQIIEMISLRSIFLEGRVEQKK